MPSAQLRWQTIATEVAIVVAGVGVYFGVRGLTESDVATAQENAREIVALQDQLGLDVEAGLQDLVDGSATLMTLLNWVYIWGHWPVIVSVLVWLLLCRPEGYRLVRTTMLISGGVGLVVFALYPLAPPRLAGLGLLDTVSEFSSSYRVLQPPGLVNQYAAMPSLHVGWDLLMGIALVSYSRRRALRVAGLLLPIAMTAAVVLTANHYVLDAVAGAALVLLSLAAARLLTARPRHHRPMVPAQRQAPHESPAGAPRPGVEAPPRASSES